MYFFFLSDKSVLPILHVFYIYRLKLIDDKLRGGGTWGSGPPYPNLPNMGQNMQPQPSYNQGGYGYGQPTGYGAPGGYGAPPGAGAYGGGYQQPPPQQAAQPSFAAGGGGRESEIFYASKSYMGRIIGTYPVSASKI